MSQGRSREPVRVDAGPGSYEVHIGPGALDRLPGLLRDRAPAHRYALIADSNVAALIGDDLAGRLTRAGLPTRLFRFPAGEMNKTREEWTRLSDALLEAGVGRDACVLALGGGVTGDLAGFVAATYMRGLPLVQLPTSLLAMIDASVGGKTGVDTPHGKNLIGAFHQPRAVVIDPDVLRTLPESELRSGMAEAVKHGAIADAAYLDWIEASAGPLLERDGDALAELIRRSVVVKADYVARDTREAGPRKALNFGHTIGHAVEAVHGFRLPHGHAVAIGMVAEAFVGETEGVTEPGAAERLRRVLRAFGLPVALPPGTRPAAVLEAAGRDKKARSSHAEYVLLERLGRVARPTDGGWAFAVAEDRVAAVLEAAGAAGVGRRETTRRQGGMTDHRGV